MSEQNPHERGCVECETECTISFLEEKKPEVKKDMAILQPFIEAADKNRQTLINGYYKDLWEACYSARAISEYMTKQLPELSESIRESFNDRSKLPKTMALISKFNDHWLMIEQAMITAIGQRKIASQERSDNAIERLYKWVLDHG